MSTARRRLVTASFAVATLALAAAVIAVLRGSGASADQLVLPQMLLSPEEHAALRERALAMVRPDERRALADGEVTTAELMAAGKATLDCIRSGAAAAAEGGPELETTGPALSPDGFAVNFTVGFRAEDGAVPQADLSGVIQRCQRDHLDHVQLVFQLDRLADRSFVARTGKGLVGCLRQAGLDVPSDTEGARRAVADAVFGGADTPGAGTASACLSRFPSVVFAPEASVASLEGDAR